MVKEITDDLSAGPLDRFSDGLKKVDKLVNELGIDIGKYSKELGEFLQKDKRSLWYQKKLLMN